MFLALALGVVLATGHAVFFMLFYPIYRDLEYGVAKVYSEGLAEGRKYQRAIPIYLIDWCLDSRSPLTRVFSFQSNGLPR